ncbi:hypothetical protein RZS08_32780, partial [Arthrospira platensis SPKY1]|nr:hypothetical protein [Arthrospira platensis SPKY1]
MGGVAPSAVAASTAPMMTQQMQQPDAPEGVSRQSFTERTLEHRPDGVIVIRERSAETQLGGSQDWAKIVREYTSAELLKGILLALALGIGGVVAIARGWPIAGMALLAG